MDDVLWLSVNVMPGSASGFVVLCEPDSITSHRTRKVDGSIDVGEILMVKQAVTVYKTGKGKIIAATVSVMTESKHHVYSW